MTDILSIPSIWDLLLRGRRRPRCCWPRTSLSIPSIWDLLLRDRCHRHDQEATHGSFQSPQSGICFCEYNPARVRENCHNTFQSPQSGICFCEALEPQRRSPPVQQTFNPLNLGSASASHSDGIQGEPRGTTLSIPSIWDLLLRDLKLRSDDFIASFQSPQSGICFCERGSELRRTPRRGYLSIPSIWDLLLRVVLTVTDSYGTGASFNPLNLGSASARRGEAHVYRNYEPLLSIPSIWDLLLRV